MKKTVILALALILCLAFAACKGPDDKQGASNTPEPEKATAAPTEAPTDAPEITDGPTEEPTPEPIPTGVPYLRETSQIVYRHDSEEEHREKIMEYDAYGNLLKHYEMFEGESMPVFDEVYEYNEHGDAVKHTCHDGSFYEYEWEYDEAGRHVKVIESFTYADGGKSPLEPIVEFEYSEDGRLTLSRYINPEGFVAGTTEYDENGRRIKQKSASVVFTCEYDDRGEMIRSVSEYSTRTEIRTFEITYDENGYVIERITYNGEDESRKPTAKQSYEYDVEGRPIKEFSYYYSNGEWMPDQTVTTEYELIYGE